MALLERVDVHFKQNHTSAARSNSHGPEHGGFCERPLVNPQPFGCSNSPQLMKEAHPIRPINTAILIFSKKIWLTKAQTCRMLGITAHPDRSTKTEGGEQHNKMEILQQQQHKKMWVL